MWTGLTGDRLMRSIEDRTQWRKIIHEAASQARQGIAHHSVRLRKSKHRFKELAQHSQPRIRFNPLDSKSNYSATSNNTKLVHWPLIVGLLCLVQQGGAWAGCGPAQSPPRCIKCNSPPINGQCTNHCVDDGPLLCGCNVWRLKS